VQAAGAVALVGDAERRLHHGSGAAIDVKLAARKPAEVGGMDWRQTAAGASGGRGGEIETDGSGGYSRARTSNPACRAMVETISGWSSCNQLVLSGLQYLHGEGHCIAAGLSRFGFIRSLTNAASDS